MRKIAAVLLCFCLLGGGALSAYAQALDGAGEGGATISATVPDRHTIEVEAEHAKVFFEGKSSVSFEVERLSRPRLLIRPDAGYRVTGVTRNGIDITAQLRNGYLTPDAVYEDVILSVRTEVSPADESSKHAISGTIRDASGKPLPGVTVELGGLTDVTDVNGKFTVKDLPDGYHPVTVTDANETVIGYTDLTIGQGVTGISPDQNGGYSLTAGKNAALDLTMTVTENGELTADEVRDVTVQDPEDGAQTGDSGRIMLWIVLAGAALCGLFTLTAYGKKRRSVK